MSSGSGQSDPPAEQRFHNGSSTVQSKGAVIWKEQKLLSRSTQLFSLQVYGDIYGLTSVTASGIKATKHFLNGKAIMPPQGGSGGDALSSSLEMFAAWMRDGRGKSQQTSQQVPPFFFHDAPPSGSIREAPIDLCEMFPIVQAQEV